MDQQTIDEIIAGRSIHKVALDIIEVVKQHMPNYQQFASLKLAVLYNLDLGDAFSIIREMDVADLNDDGGVEG